MKKEYLDGKRRKKNGYVVVKAPSHPFCMNDGYVYEHRLVVEYYEGRYLRKDEIIHHVNHERDDNRIENLMITNHIEHMRMHRIHCSKMKNIKDLYIYGFSVREIARMLDVGKSTVHTYCQEMNITRTNKRIEALD